MTRRVTGLREVKARLAAIPEVIASEVSQQLEKEADKLVSEMRLLVPVKFGKLRASIGWTWGAAPEGSFSIGAFKGSAYAKLKITIFAGDKTTQEGVFNVAMLQEFGTKKMAANPYFFPVYRANKRRVAGNLTRAVTRGVKKL